MDYHGQLPKRAYTHKLETESKRVFENILDENLFIIQSEDKKDYGTDLQIELIDNENVTNYLTQIQLKATEAVSNKNQSVSVSVEVSNVNYLSRQKFSMYICYHKPSNRLLVKFVDEVIRDYEHRNSDWRNQKTITVNFSTVFDDTFQKNLHNRMFTFFNKGYQRDQKWNIDSISEINSLIKKNKKIIHIPNDPIKAQKLLNALYEENEDLTISDYFDEFGAILGFRNHQMQPAYMAEANLGVNGEKFNAKRVEKAITLFKKELTRKRMRYYPHSILYCIGNSWLALKEYEKAKDAYLKVLLLDDSEKSILAMCCKNLGSVFESLGKIQLAIDHYDLALQYNPNLSEAHFALGINLYRSGKDYDKALESLDACSFSSERQNTAVRAWRIPILFELNDINGAFREINNIRGYHDKYKWILPWCAKNVDQYTNNVEAVKKGILFWKFFLEHRPEDLQAQRAYFLSQWYLHEHNEKSEINYEYFKKNIIRLFKEDNSDSAFLWDRIGHWAQTDGNWVEAENAYRKAYTMGSEDHYGYCLGVALNALGKYHEAIPLLLEQALTYQPDAMSWFQLGFAYEKSLDIKKSIKAYNKAIELDLDYDLAWFSLGGVYWNAQEYAEAIKVWEEAIKKFPDHELAYKLYDELPSIFNKER